MVDIVDTISTVEHCTRIAKKLEELNDLHDLLTFYNKTDSKEEQDELRFPFFILFAPCKKEPTSQVDWEKFYIKYSLKLEHAWREEVCKLFVDKKVLIITRTHASTIRQAAETVCTTAHVQAKGICVFSNNNGTAHSIVPQHFEDRKKLIGFSGGKTQDIRSIEIIE